MSETRGSRDEPHKMRSLFKFACVAATSALALVSLDARADIALESYRDQRSPDAEGTLERLKSALESHQVVTKPDRILERVGSYVPLSGYPDHDVTRTKLIERIEKAVNRAAHEAYGEAAAILESVFRDLDNNPALAASDPESRSWVTKGRVALAFSYARGKKLKLANNVIADHIRSYPDLSLKGEQEEVEKLYDANVAAIGPESRGQLVFRVNRPDAEIFVNAVARGKGQIALSLVPGEYRIVVRAAGVYRSYRVTVRLKETTVRAVDWLADATFNPGPDWIGFAWPRESQRSVRTFVQQLADRSPDDAVILIGIVPHDGRRYLTAKRYVATSGSHRPGRALEIDHSDDAKIESLATYITAPDSATADLASRGLVPIPDDDEVAVSAPAPEAAGVAPRWPIFIAVGVFGTSVPLGSYLLKTRNDCYTSCSRLAVPSAWGLLGLGGVALGFGIAWIVHGDHAITPSPPMLDVQPVPGGGVAYLNGSF